MALRTNLGVICTTNQFRVYLSLTKSYNKTYMVLIIQWRVTQLYLKIHFNHLKEEEVNTTLRQKEEEEFNGLSHNRTSQSRKKNTYIIINDEHKYLMIWLDAFFC